MSDEPTSVRGPRRGILLALVACCVAGAGCTGLLGDGGSTPSAAPAESPAQSPTGPTHAAPSDTATSDRGSETTTDGHAHTHGTGTETGGAASEPPDSSTAGRITVAVDGTQLNLSSRDRPDGFDVTADDEHTWVAANESTTLAAALGSFGLAANETALAVDGETYRDGVNGTTVAYRVDGEPVDPTNYEIQDADFVWVTVHTPATPATPSGAAIDVGQQHAHGPINVTVEGSQLDFSRERFQGADRFFHFEGGNGETWHAHHTAVSLEYALNSLPDVAANASSFTHDGTVYDAASPNVSISYRVGGESVEPGEYYLNDGDAITVVVEREE